MVFVEGTIPDVSSESISFIHDSGSTQTFSVSAYTTVYMEQRIPTDTQVITVGEALDEQPDPYVIVGLGDIPFGTQATIGYSLSDRRTTPDAWVVAFPQP
jgi:hypothetical protein